MELAHSSTDRWSVQLFRYDKSYFVFIVVSAKIAKNKKLKKSFFSFFEKWQILNSITLVEGVRNISFDQDHRNEFKLVPILILAVIRFCNSLAEKLINKNTKIFFFKNKNKVASFIEILT